MTDQLYPAFAFLGFVIVLIPLPWHLQAWNAGTCLFMIWTATGCLIHFVNSIVWAGNLELHSAVWCDISSKLIVGLSVALPCASLCINRRLYSIARVSQVYITRAEKRRTVCIDIAIGVGFPIIVMALHYIVQGHRFDIFENVGCWPSTFNTPPAYPLVWMWPILIGLISMIYCALSLRAFLQRRREFNDLLATDKNLNMNRYFRLMALATIEICTTTPFAIYFMYLDATSLEISPWVSWSDTKWHFSRIDYVPAYLVNSNPMLRLSFSLNLWLFPACAILFFAFFGFAEEARRNYMKLYYLMAKPFGITRTVSTQGRMHNAQVFTKRVVLPSTYSSSVEGFSERGLKWDELSLEMPEMAPNVAASPSIIITDAVSFRSSLHAPRSPPLDGPHCPASLDASKSSSFHVSDGHVDHNPAPTDIYPRVPAVIVTRPNSEVSLTGNVGFVPQLTSQTMPHGTPRVLHPTPRQVTYLSTSTNIEIGVSSASFPAGHNP